MSPIDRLLEKFPNATKAGEGWSDCCPAHEDRRASLSIGEGDDGRALVHCFAGCSVDSICNAVGLRVADLMPDNRTDIDTTSKRPTKTPVVSKGKPAKTFPTAKAAIADLERWNGKRSAHWTYNNADGESVGVVVRWEKLDGGKDIRPVARRGDAWVIGGMPEPRPLYNLPALGTADRVFVTEGEKAADAAGSIGLTATTSAHGAKSPAKTDWSPLSGKECVILPDNDKAGADYAETVANILAGLSPAPKIKIVNLPELSDGDDIADWVAAQPDTDAAKLQQKVIAMADKAEHVQPVQPAGRIVPFQPFPTDTLPEPIRGFVTAGAKTIGCDTSYLALPMLTVLAAAIGNSRRIQLKRTWSEPAILWSAIMGDSGSMKSPALEMVLRPIRERQKKAFGEYAERMAEFNDAMVRYENELARFKKAKGGDDPPEKPVEPIAERYWCDDLTTEALYVLLKNQWRGLLMVRDELAGWLRGFDRYSQGKGSDVARWLEMFGGRSSIIDRKGGNPPTLYVPRAAVSVTGGIQPEVLKDCLGKENRENGLAARLLLAYPPRRIKRWAEGDNNEQCETAVANVVDGLYNLQPEVDDDGNSHPVCVDLSPEAKGDWIQFYNEHAQEHAELSGDLSAAWSKLEGYAARFALVIHLARAVANDPQLESPDTIDRLSIGAGVRLSRWFGQEARRIYAILDESEEEGKRRKLAERIQRKGGSVTARDLQRMSGKHKTAAAAETALGELVNAGYGQWVNQSTTQKGGRPTRLFVMHGAAQTDTTNHSSGKNGGSVNVDGGQSPENEWGEV